MEKETFIIVDWAGNRRLSKEEFKTFEDGWECIYSLVDNEDAYQEYYVIPMPAIDRYLTRV